MTPCHVAVVLAAGGSRRLGHAKQLLTCRGETLVHRAVRLASITAPARLLLVVGAQRDAVSMSVRGLHCEVVVNAAWEDGLAGSLRAAALALQDGTAPVLLLGCDQPALAAGQLQALLDSARVSTSGCAASAYAGVVGIPAVVPADWLAAAAAAGDRGLAGRLRALPADALARLDAPALHFDIDTPGDVQAAVAAGWLDPALVPRRAGV